MNAAVAFVVPLFVNFNFRLGTGTNQWEFGEGPEASSEIGARFLLKAHYESTLSAPSKIRSNDRYTQWDEHHLRYKSCFVILSSDSLKKPTLCSAVESIRQWNVIDCVHYIYVEVGNEWWRHSSVNWTNRAASKWPVEWRMNDERLLLYC